MTQHEHRRQINRALIASIIVVVAGLLWAAAPLSKMATLQKSPIPIVNTEE